uniref:Extracellular ribonuclease LE n=1 Tax=Caligus rogercresseyi TaxID=217165 RepID=C1BR53_CALRO|nr:Extracellular ribonuclease LE precursor [Caligus rogercresseyi]
MERSLFILSVVSLSIFSLATATAAEFDFLYFTQVWPQSACEKWKEGNENHTCNLRNGQDWSIHGVWPTKDNVIGPLYCDNSTHFDPEAIKSILPQLEAHWIDVHGGHHSKYQFWKHEFLKHGTCAESILELSTELLYFQKGLELHERYDVSQLLIQGNVHQGSSYNAESFINAVKNSLGGYAPALECDTDSQGHFLYQVGICLSKSFELMSCESVKGGLYGNCPQSTNSLIRYPYGPGSSGVSFGVVFVTLLCMVLFAGLGYFLYSKYLNHRRLAEYNRI